MSEKIPTTEEIREDYGWMVADCGCCTDRPDEAEGRFDDWLAKHDADLREQIAREIDADRASAMNLDSRPVDPYVLGLADAAGVVRRNGASA